MAASTLPWEVGNALVALVQRRKMTAPDVGRGWRAFLRIPVRYAEIDVPGALGLALEHGLCAYDAYVLAAARAAQAPLLTVDKRQLDAARASGITLLEVA